jgi:hypothetical protein
MTKAAGRWLAADLLYGWVVPGKCLTKWRSRMLAACVGAQSSQDALPPVMYCSSDSREHCFRSSTVHKCWIFCFPVEAKRDTSFTMLSLSMLALGWMALRTWLKFELPVFAVEALKGIANKLNKTDWDFSVDPCSRSGSWANSTGLFVSNVTCDCSFKNYTECHIIGL